MINCEELKVALGDLDGDKVAELLDELKASKGGRTRGQFSRPTNRLHHPGIASHVWSHCCSIL